MPNETIVVFDSGVGGLPYLQSTRDRIPNATCLYVADRTGFPYGRKTREEVKTLVLDRLEKIIDRFSPRLVILACNTASQAALEPARARFPGVSIVGTVPAVKPAAQSTRTGTIAVLSTDRAAVDPYLDDLVERWARGVRVVRVGAQDLVEFVERGFLDASEDDRLAACRYAVDQVRENGADRIVLACTHFLHVADYISAAAGPGIQIVDSREGVTRRAAAVFASAGSRIPGYTRTASPGSDGLFATGGPDDWSGLDRFARRFNLEFGGAL